MSKNSAVSLIVKRYNTLQALVRQSERIGLCRATEMFAAVSPMCARLLLEQLHTNNSNTQLESLNYIVAMIEVESNHRSMVVQIYVDISIGIVKENFSTEQVPLEIYMNDNLMKHLEIDSDCSVKISRIIRECDMDCWDSVTLYPMSSDSNLRYEYVIYCMKHYHYIQNNSLVHLPASLYINGSDLNDYYTYRVVCNGRSSGDNIRWGKIHQHITKIHLESYLTHIITQNHQNEQQAVLIDEQEKSFESLVKYSLGILGSNTLRNIISPPRSFLLHGPRGVGKSEMLERIALRNGVKLKKLSPSDIYEQSYAGEQGLAHLRTQYQRAVDIKPIIWVIDELDVLFTSRDEEKDKQLVDEFLSILEDPLEGVCIVGVTSNTHALDPFIRKKFNEEVFIDVPSNQERVELLRIHLEKLQNVDRSIHSNIDSCLELLNAKCHGYVQADISSIFKKLSELSQTTAVTMADILSVIKDHSPYSTKETSFSLTTPEIPKVRWEDIGGLQEIKQKLEEMIVWPMKYKSAYEKLSIKPPNGLLLYGPPGTGKTMIAKAVATAANANFISINIPDLIKSEIGESEKTLAKIFRRAKLASPCVVFFDEIQAMFGDRNDVSKDQQKLISQLLLELDALDEPDISKNPTNVILIAATNVPQNIDPSILRTGRVEHILHVGAPDATARRAIFEMTLKKMKVSQQVYDKISEYVTRTGMFYTGADLVNICQQAGLSALCESLEAQEVQAKHFELAFQSVQPSITIEMLTFFSNWRVK